MKTIRERICSVGLPDEKAGMEARAHWDAIAKPLGSLGQFEEMIIQIAALRGNAVFCLKKRVLTVFCADNGVTAQGVSQCGSVVTARVAAALAEGKSTANRMACQVNCRVIPVDVGILDFPGHPNVRRMRVRNGTGDISREPAMTREECLKAMEYGAALAEELSQKGTDLLAVGEMGIGNTTTATALAAAMLGLEPDEITGRGAGLSSEGLVRKRAAIRQALARQTCSSNDTTGLMAELGGLDIAAMCGAFIGAAECRLPVIIDGVISEVAALCAMRLCPAVKSAMLPSHLSAEPVARLLQDAMGIHAPIDANLHLGEGTGALMLMPMLDAAMAVYQSGESFRELGIEAYQPWI